MGTTFLGKLRPAFWIDHARNKYGFYVTLISLNFHRVYINLLNPMETMHTFHTIFGVLFHDSSDEYKVINLIGF